MTQYARPSSDLGNDGGWSSYPSGLLYTCIDEETASDSDYITGDTEDNYYSTRLSEVTDPVVHTDHVLRWRWRATTNSPQPETADIRLRQISYTTVWSSGEVDVPRTWTTESHTLTTGEAAAIVGYDILYVQVGPLQLQTSESIEVSWIVLEVPDASLPDVEVTPAEASAIASGQSPSVTLGSITKTPAEASAIASGQDPAVVLGSITKTPAEASSIASAQDPGVQIGQPPITPTAASGIASGQGPTITLGSITLTPAILSAIATGQDPATVEGSISLAPGEAAAIATAQDPQVRLGSVAIAVAAALALAEALDPALIFTSVTVIPAQAGGIGSAQDPQVTAGGNVEIAPAAVIGYAIAIDPQVEGGAGPGGEGWKVLNLFQTFGVGGRR